jgi:chromosome partitioning protein
MSDLRIVALAAGRGGSGKTTLTYAIGDVLHRLRGEPDVAIIDLDPQANLTSYAGHDPVEEPLTAPPVMVHGLALYRGGRSLAEATLAQRAALIDRVLREGAPGRVLIADLPPALHDPIHRVLFERDDVIWLGAIRAEPGSFQSMNEMVAMCARAHAPYVLVPTFHIKNRSVITATSMALRSQHTGHVARTVIPDDSKAKECVLAGMPVTLFARRSKAAEAIAALVAEVFGDEEELAVEGGESAAGAEQGAVGAAQGGAAASGARSAAPEPAKAPADGAATPHARGAAGAATVAKPAARAAPVSATRAATAPGHARDGRRAATSTTTSPGGRRKG